MKIVLVGGTGFVGEYLSKNLNSRKKDEVVVAGRETSLRNCCKDAQVIVVMTQPNRKVMKELADFTASAKSLNKIVYLSTLLLYPSSTKKNNEEKLPDPLTDYEKNKYKEELFLSEITKKYDRYLTIARLGNIYGDVKNKGIINLLFRALIQKEDLVIQGDPVKKIRDYIFIEDAVYFLEFLVFQSQKKQKEIFNVCTGKGTSLLKLIEKAGAISGGKINFISEEQIREKKAIRGDNRKILALSGYKIKYSLTKGLKKTYQNYLNYLI